MSNTFIEATYPIAVYQGELQADPYVGSPLKCDGVLEDIRNIGVRAIRLGWEKALGIVSAGYFKYHNDPANKKCVFAKPDGSTTGGLSLCNSRGGLIREDLWTAAAHELGHMHGICVQPEEYESHPPGNPANGFWVSAGEEIKNSTCFMGNSPSHTIDTRWVEDNDYNILFRALRVDKKDPAMMVVTGMLHLDGTVELRPWYFMSNGTVDSSAPGDYAVRVLDSTGHLLSETTVPVEFVVYTQPLGARSTDKVPLVVSVPYGTTAATIQILRQGKVVVSVATTTKVLHDAIDAVPDIGFDKNPPDRRQALHDKINELESLLSKKKYRDAQDKLRNDIIPHLESWLVGYVKIDPLQMEKTEVIAVADAMMARVANFGR